MDLVVLGCIRNRCRFQRKFSSLQDVDYKLMKRAYDNPWYKLVTRALAPRREVGTDLRRRPVGAVVDGGLEAAVVYLE